MKDLRLKFKFTRGISHFVSQIIQLVKYFKSNKYLFHSRNGNIWIQFFFISGMFQVIVHLTRAEYHLPHSRSIVYCWTTIWYDTEKYIPWLFNRYLKRARNQSENTEKIIIHRKNSVFSFISSKLDRASGWRNNDLGVIRMQGLRNGRAICRRKMWK